jgi:hypothetical protein
MAGSLVYGHKPLDLPKEDAGTIPRLPVPH